VTRALIILAGDRERAKAINWIATAPVNTRVEFKAARRSLDQNAAMWAALTELASQLEWHGQKYTAEDWKDYLMHALKRARWMPDEDGGMVPIGMRTSDLSKAEMSDLLELIHEFAARHNITLHDPTEQVREREVA
jgi:hypothetical protein